MFIYMSLCYSWLATCGCVTGVPVTVCLLMHPCHCMQVCHCHCHTMSAAALPPLDAKCLPLYHCQHMQVCHCHCHCHHVSTTVPFLACYMWVGHMCKCHSVSATAPLLLHEGVSLSLSKCEGHCFTIITCGYFIFTVTNYHSQLLLLHAGVSLSLSECAHNTVPLSLHYIILLNMSMSHGHCHCHNAHVSVLKMQVNEWWNVNIRHKLKSYLPRLYPK